MSATYSQASTNQKVEHRTPTASSARASIAGVGGGTGLVALAQSIGPHTTLGLVLVYAAPAASFVIGAVQYYLEVQASRYLWLRVVNSARKTLEQQLDNPRTSDPHKVRMRKRLEQLEEAVASAELERVSIFNLAPRR
jgi:hypothetical protein